MEPKETKRSKSPDGPKELKIDDVAKETGLTKRTIRYYEEIGLIAPPHRSAGGIRLYGEEDVERLKKLLLAREVLGFSLLELQKYLQINELIERHKSNYRSSTDRVERRNELVGIEEALREETAMIDEKIKRMEEFKQELEQLRGRVREALRDYED